MVNSNENNQDNEANDSKLQLVEQIDPTVILSPPPKAIKRVDDDGAQSTTNTQNTVSGSDGFNSIKSSTQSHHHYKTNNSKHHHNNGNNNHDDSDDDDSNNNNHNKHNDNDESKPQSDDTDQLSRQDQWDKKYDNIKNKKVFKRHSRLSSSEHTAREEYTKIMKHEFGFDQGMYLMYDLECIFNSILCARMFCLVCT